MSKTVEGVKYDLSDGVTAEELDEAVVGEFKKSQSAFSKGFVRLQPYNQVMPRVYAGFERRIREMEARPDDVWVASFPKCGTLLCHNPINFQFQIQIAFLA